MPRTLRPGQRAELFVVEVASGEQRLVFASSELLFEAPNWSPDGDWLVVNGDGRLFRLPVAGGTELEEIELGGVPAINNDHVLSPEGSTVYVSADDGHLYAVPSGGGSSRRVSNDRGAGFHHYLHGVSPDGSTLAYIGLEDRDGKRIANVWTIPAAGGDDVQVTDDEYADDGPEYGPDGQWIYINSERASTEPGHAQLFRISGGEVEQLTFDERVNWFPHPSPDGSMVAYVSFPPGTLGHPADVEDVRLRLLTPSGPGPRPGHPLRRPGHDERPSWSPTSTHFAYVAYPID